MNSGVLSVPQAAPNPQQKPSAGPGAGVSAPTGAQQAQATSQVAPMQQQQQGGADMNKLKDLLGQLGGGGGGST